jgi:NAD+ kinase
VTAVAFVAHREITAAHDLARDTIAWLRADGHDAWVPADEARVLGLPDLSAERPTTNADLIVCLGGDGTMLHAVNLIDGASVPVLGVNFGRLGYLTEVEVDQIRDALGRFTMGERDGGWTLDQRMMLTAEVLGEGDRVDESWRALNEAVVEKRESGHTVHLRLRIDGDPFTSYAADGMIVSTPTGSTAYSLSARGPVVSPKHRALLVTPVAPHMLFDRSLVLDPAESVEIEVIGDRAASLAIDGRAVRQLQPGSIVRCRPSSRTANFVRFGEHRYHQVLKAKFGLMDR